MRLKMDLEKLYDNPVKLEIKNKILFADNKTIEPSIKL